MAAPLPVTAPLQQRVGALLQRPQPHPQAPQLKNPPQIKAAKLQLNTPSNNVAANVSRAVSAIAAVTPPPYRVPLLGVASVLTAWSASQSPTLPRFQVEDLWPLNGGYVPHPSRPVAHVQPDGSEVEPPRLEGKSSMPHDARFSAVPGKAIHDSTPPAEGRGVLEPPQAKDFILMSENGEAKRREWMDLGVGRDINPSTLRYGHSDQDVEVIHVPEGTQAALRVDTQDGGYRFASVQVSHGVAVVNAAHKGEQFHLATELKHERDMYLRVLAELQAQNVPVLKLNVVLPTLPTEEGVRFPSAEKLLDEYAMAGSRGATQEDKWRAAVERLPVTQTQKELGLKLDRVVPGDDHLIATYVYRDATKRDKAQTAMEEMRNRTQGGQVQADHVDGTTASSLSAKGIASHAGAPTLSEIQSVVSGAQVAFDGHEFVIAKQAGNNASFVAMGGVEQGKLMYRYDAKVSDEVFADMAFGDPVKRALIDQILGDAEKGHLVLTVNEASKRNLPVHEVLISFKPEAEATRGASYSSLELKRRLAEDGLTMDGLSYGELPADSPVAAVVKDLPFSNLMNQYGLVPASIVHAGPAGLMVTYKYEDLSMRAQYEKKTEQELLLQLEASKNARGSSTH